jgi:hypothetical protein
MKDIHPSWQLAVDSLDDVIAALGGSIRDKSGKTYDPGQAVCRELFGPDWMRSEEFALFDGAEECDPAFFEAVGRLARKEAPWLALPD